MVSLSPFIHIVPPPPHPPVIYTVTTGPNIVESKNFYDNGISNAVKLINRIDNYNSFTKLYTEVDSHFNVGDVVYITDTNNMINSLTLDNLVVNFDKYSKRASFGYNVIFTNSYNNEVAIDYPYQYSSGVTLYNTYISKVSMRNTVINGGFWNSLILFNSQVTGYTVNHLQSIIVNSTVCGVTFNDKYSFNYLSLNATDLNSSNVYNNVTNYTDVTEFSTGKASTTVASSYSSNNNKFGYSYNINSNLYDCNINNGYFLNSNLTGVTINSDYINNGYFSGCTFDCYIINDGYYYDCMFFSGGTVQLPNCVWNYGTWDNANSNVTFSGTSFWNDGIWNNGNFFEGYWNNGVFNSGMIKNSTWINGIFNNSDSIFYDSTWLTGTFNNGVFFDSSWSGGTFNNGTFTSGSSWYDGVFNNGTFTDSSLWYDGTFNNGTFTNSVWVGGTFNNGTFQLSLWLNGNFYLGTMSNSSCLGGTFYGQTDNLNNENVVSNSATFKDVYFNNCTLVNGYYNSDQSITVNPTTGDPTNTSVISACTIYYGNYNNYAISDSKIIDGLYNQCYIYLTNIQKAVYSGSVSRTYNAVIGHYGTTDIPMNWSGGTFNGGTFGHTGNSHDFGTSATTSWDNWLSGDFVSGNFYGIWYGGRWLGGNWYGWNRLTWDNTKPGTQPGHPYNPIFVNTLLTG